MLTQAKKILEKFPTEQDLKMELKRVQSIKCRLKKQKFRKDYEHEMTKTLTYEQSLKEAHDLIKPKKVTTTTMTIDDIKILTYNETIKAIKSIQSKKCLTKYNVENLDENLEYQEACKIEKMLLEHKEEIQDQENDNKVSKNDVATILETIKSNKELSQEQILEMLQKLI